EAWLVPGEGKRMQVRPITSKDVHEIIQIRNLVEYSALDELFARGEPRVIAGQLDFILNEMKAAQEEYSLVTLDLKFHNLLVESMNNGRLLRFWCAVQDEVKRMGLLRLRGNDRWQEVINEHERLVEMLWNKDPVRTKLALREHLEHSYANLTNDIE
ncbi:MAG: FCD domain-containing protein, partial [Synergistes sp.]|nr:FCD domain-containing protein [Synergistes sp.]